MILFILPSFSGGGAERVLINILSYLHNCNYDVRIVVINSLGPLSKGLPKTIPIYDLRKSSFKYSILKLTYLIWRIRPKIIFSTFGYINIAILLLKIFLPSSTRIWLREANIPSISLPNNPNPKLFNKLYLNLYKYTDKLICSSELMKTEFVNLYKVPEHKISILPNPVDEDKIRIVASTLNRDIGTGVLFIAAGRITHQKGFDNLLIWFSRLNNEKSKLRIFGDGDGDLLLELENLALDLGINNRIFFSPFSHDLWSWIAGCDAFLLSSRWEGMSNAALEALACGTPVISTATSGGILELRDQATPGAVTVCDTGDLFVNAMENVFPKSNSTTSKSLLPQNYKITNAVLSIKKWIDKSL